MEKKFNELNYYEILNIKPDSASFEVRHAYNAALYMYNADSMVSHSFFSQEERKEILSLVEKAYLTLINEKERQSYDNEFINLGVLDAKKLNIRIKKPVCIFDVNRNQNPGQNSVSLKSNDRLREKVAQCKRIQEISAQKGISGADLKEIRTALGVSMEHVAGETKISTNYLKAIEEENISRLPAIVFLKGFIKAYLKCLCLESVDDLCSKYMNSLPHVEKK